MTTASCLYDTRVDVRDQTAHQKGKNMSTHSDRLSITTSTSELSASSLNPSNLFVLLSEVPASPPACLGKKIGIAPSSSPASQGIPTSSGFVAQTSSLSSSSQWLTCGSAPSSLGDLERRLHLEYEERARGAPRFPSAPPKRTSLMREGWKEELGLGPLPEE